MNGLEFTRAWLWPSLLLLPLWFAALHAMLRRRTVAARTYGAATKDRVQGPFARASRLTVLTALGLLCWMDPRLGDETLPVARRGLDLVFCLDTSRSMLASDMEPDRLSRAKSDIRAVLPQLAGGDRVGLVVFAGEARLWIPLTHDIPSFGRLLDEVDTTVVPVGGTDLGKALAKARELAKPEEAATTAFVLLTDGEDLGGKGLSAAKDVGKDGIVVHAVGYGSAKGSKITLQKGGEQQFLRDNKGGEVVSRLDTEGLRAMCAAAGGEFVRADAMALPLRELYDKRIEPMQKRTFEEGQEIAKQARYQWALLPMVLLLLYELAWMRGARR